MLFSDITPNPAAILLNPLCWHNEYTRKIPIIYKAQRPDSKVPGANMGSIWGRQVPGGPRVGPMNFVILGIIAPVAWDQFDGSAALSHCHEDPFLYFDYTNHSYTAFPTQCLKQDANINVAPSFSSACHLGLLLENLHVVKSLQNVKAVHSWMKSCRPNIVNLPVYHGRVIYIESVRTTYK